MQLSSKKGMSEGGSTTESDLFHQLFSQYIHQVGVKYESTKAVQVAIKRLEKEMQTPARTTARLPKRPR